MESIKSRRQKRRRSAGEKEERERRSIETKAAPARVREGENQRRFVEENSGSDATQPV